jgi:hypothetical protein
MDGNVLTKKSGRDDRGKQNSFPQLSSTKALSSPDCFMDRFIRERKNSETPFSVSILAIPLAVLLEEEKPFSSCLRRIIFFSKLITPH